MKNFYVLLLALLFSFGCTAINEPDPIKPEPKPDPKPDPITAQITIKTPDVVLSDVEGSTTTAEFTSTANWTIETSDTKATPDWLEVLQNGGDAGDITLSIKATKSNENYNDRNRYIKVKSGAVTKTITVTQKKKDAITLSKDHYEVSVEGGTINVEVKSNISYSVEVLDDWIKQSMTYTKTLVTTNFDIVVQSNDKNEARTGKVIVKGNNLADTITIIQKSIDASFLEVNIEVAGTLSELLQPIDPTTITALRLRGVMSFKDFVTVNILPNIELLDIENVEIDEIPDYALNYSTLTDITLPKSITKIGIDALKGSADLRSIHIAANVEIIESAAFKGCTKLASVTFEAGSKLKTIGGGYTAITNGNDYYGAFSDCSSLTSIIIPANIETIEASAFKGCTKLASVTFEAGSKLKTIGGGHSSSYGAFSSCTALTLITVPASVEAIEFGAFYGCSKLAGVTFETGSKLKSLSGFNNCTSLTSITIAASVETIGSNAFSRCSNLSSVTFERGSKLKSLSGFDSCTSLISFTIPASVETIGSDVFDGCSKLVGVTFEAGSRLKSLSSFNNCTSLTSITIPASVETIGSGAFYGCSKLASITFEAGSQLKSLSSFNNCTSLTSITVPASVETIGYDAFIGCSELVGVTFETGSKLEAIGDEYSSSYGAFYNCVSLMTFDASKCELITAISSYAFINCSKLNLFKIGTLYPPYCNYGAFYSIDSNAELQVAAGSVEDYKVADGWKDSFATITALE